MKKTMILLALILGAGFSQYAFAADDADEITVVDSDSATILPDGATAMGISHNARGISYNSGDRRYDNRVYVNWNDMPYRMIYKMVMAGGGSCTGVAVNDQYFVTNKHCSDGCQNGCQIISHDGKRAQLGRPIRTGSNNPRSRTESIANDWAIYRVDFGTRPDFSAKQISPRLYGREVTVARAGFGGLKILSNSEISQIRNLHSQFLRTHPRAGPDINTREFMPYLRRAGLNIFSDGNRLKAVTSCKATFDRQIISHTCDSWSGDSGSGIYVQSNGNWYLVGLNNSGTHDLKLAKIGSWGPNISNFIQYLKPPVQQHASNPVANRPPQTNNSAGRPNTNASMANIVQILRNAARK